MKVALIGNMNNNNFSIMRYFRDFGINAHLILFKDDITKNQSHFKPEFDTWNIAKWSPYIHYINFNSYHAALFYPAFLLKKYFKGYDILISTGISPVILNKCGINVDIYYPYGVGIEGIGDQLTRKNWKGKPFITRIVRSILRRLKISAIKKANTCLNNEMNMTKKTFDELDIPFERVSIPMVYNKENIKKKKLSELRLKINRYKYKFFCHVSHIPTKDNMPMIEGFAKFVHSQKSKDCVLVLLEYGLQNSIEITKKRLKDLGVEDNVLWLSKKSRKELMLLLDSIDFGFSEFDGLIWGGTGWEFLSKGVPFFHFIDMNSEDFEREFNTPMPSIINTNSSDEIYYHLIKFTENPHLYKKRGIEMKDWFEQYGGIGLAKKWKNIILKIYQEKQSIESN
tara:strand:+ start:677 stop:1867 length:1191 start_codon:yes stop_codon:yes gene_type:complete